MQETSQPNSSSCRDLIWEYIHNTQILLDPLKSAPAIQYYSFYFKSLQLWILLFRYIETGDIRRCLCKPNKRSITDINAFEMESTVSISLFFI